LSRSDRIASCCASISACCSQRTIGQHVRDHRVQVVECVAAVQRRA
jgi:hypothetical protein